MNDLFGRRSALGLALLCLLPLAGCSHVKVAQVSGKVTCRNATVPSGTVVFVGEGGRVESAEIQQDGSYSIAKAPVGPVKISVTTYAPWAPPTKSQVAGQSAETPPGKKPFVRVPDGYRNPDSSGLTYTVLPGEQTHDLPLK